MPRRIAVIDDDEDNRDLLAAVLRDDQEIVTFNSGPDFLKQFVPGGFDLILLDIGMPEMDGFEVLKRIHAQDRNVPVVAITAIAVSFEAERERALAEGFSDYFVKPITDPETFREAVLSHLG